MIKQTFTDAFDQDWIKRNITDPTNEMVLIRQIIPWDQLVDELSQFYCESKGRIGSSIRIVVAVLLLSKFRNLSDENVIKQIKENRYYQFFCNVPDEDLFNFLNPSTLCRARQRYGEKGIEIIEELVFQRFRLAGVVDSQYALTDSSVLENNIVYPTDVNLLYNAFKKLALFAKHNNLNQWWDHEEIKKMMRQFRLNKEKDALLYLFELSFLLKEALSIFEIYVQYLDMPEKSRNKAEQLMEILILLDEQTDMKLEGKTHIKNRIVSLDEVEARPIKKGKTYPKCEFGSTFQCTFNRQGFMITVENFVGKPDDTKFYPDALELFKKRMKKYPDIFVTDLGYRSKKNFDVAKGKVDTVFLGRSDDVEPMHRDQCHKARSATEGFIAVIKHWRGMKRSLYKGLSGDRIWSLLCQAAHNLKKFIQLYKKEELSDESLMDLGLLG